MIVFLSTLLFLLPVFASSAVYWIGGSGLWSDGTKWSNQQQPASSSEVYINSSSYSVVTIDGDVTVSKLVIEDGVIDIGIGSLTVQNAFTFYKGTLTRQQAKLYNPITSIPSAGLVSVLGNSSFLSGNRKRMEFISFVQKPNTTLEWFNGDLILTNSTITIEKNARFVVTSKTSNLTLASDQAQRYFNYYPYRLLNTALNLVTMYPPNEGVYDIISPDVVRVSTTSTYGQTLYPLAVKDDPEAIAYFAYHVTNSNFGYRLPLYNRTIVDVDPDQCAWICTTAYQQWCASFEYLTYNRTCKLGAFNLIKAGGLSYEVQTAQGVEYPVYHYERRILEERPVDSFLIVEGSMVTSCDDPLTSCNLFLTVRTTVTGALSILDHSSVLFTDQVVLESSSISSLTPTSSLAAVGINSSLIMEYGADLTSSSMSPISFPVLTLQDGHHFVSGNISPDFSFIIMGTAQVDIQCTASPTGNISQSVFSHLAVQDNGVLAFVSSSSTVNVSGNVNLTDSAVMTGYSLNISISGVLFVSASASLSVAFNGYNSDGGGYKGLGAGADYSLGASGGSYGGKGGPGKVDTLGGAYGSAVHPWHLGSAGGVGYRTVSARSGAGGGALTVSSPYIYLNGQLSADGANGEDGGGGGSGGSIAVYCDIITGNGTFTAKGGDGGYAGGLIAGGGGSGGRIAIHANQFRWDGQYVIHGGTLVKTYDVLDPEQAGGGTLYVEATGSPSFKALLTSDQPMFNINANLVSRLQYTDAKPRLSSDRYRPAVVLDSLSCDVDLHVNGVSGLTLSGPSYCFGELLGSGSNPMIEIVGNASLSFSSSDWSLRKGAQVHLRNATLLDNKMNITILQSGALYLYSNDGISAGVRESWYFDVVTVLNGGSLYFVNDSVVLNSAQLNILTGGFAFFSNEISLNSSDLRLQGCQLYGYNLASLSSVSILHTTRTTFASSIRGQNVRLNLYSTTTLLTDANITGDSNFELWMHDSSITLVASGGTVSADISLRLLNNSLLQVNESSTFSIGGSLTTYHNSLLKTMQSAIVQLQGSAHFNCFDGSDLGGEGTIIIMNSAIMTMPSFLHSNSAAVISQSGGTLLFCAAPDCISLESSIRSFNIMSSISINSFGSLLVGHNSTATFSRLHLVNDGLVELVTASSVLAIQDQNSTLEGGVVDGPGIMRVNANSRLSLQPDSLITFLKTQVVNLGTLITEDQVVNWARHSSVVNYGTIVASGSQQWTFNQSMYAFEPSQYCLQDAPSEDAPMLFNISVEDCGYKCAHQLIRLTSMLEAQRFYQDDYDCRGFLYNVDIAACKLVTVQIDGTDLCSNFNHPNRAYRIYSKVDEWVDNPQVNNTIAGRIIAENSASLDVSLTLLNNGVVKTHVGGSMVFRAGVVQSSVGSIQSDGSMSVGGYQSSIISGNLQGNGSLTIFAEDKLYYNKALTILQAVTIINTEITLNILSQLDIYTNLVPYELKNWVIDGGQATVYNSSLTLIANDDFIVKSGGTMLSYDNIVSDDSGCANCFDFNITATNFVIEPSSSFSLSYGYVTASNVLIDSNGSLTCSHRGYSMQRPGFSSGLQGTYRFLGSSGGGHAGLGGAGYRDHLDSFPLYSTSTEHGTYHVASTWGYPGGVWADATDSNGGGRVFISASSVIVNGLLQCDGQTPLNSIAGGGAGGSVHIEAHTLAGAGGITAKGGGGGVRYSESFGHGGGGGGGRISLHVDYLLFQGLLSTAGGVGYQRGSSGTLFVRNTTIGDGGKLTIDGDHANAEDFHYRIGTVISSSSPFGPLESFTLNGNAKVLVKRGANYSFECGPVLGDGSGTLMILNHTIFTPYAPIQGGSSLHPMRLSLQDATLVIADSLLNSSNVDVAAGGILSITLAGGTNAVKSAFYSFQDGQVAGTIRFDYNSADPLHLQNLITLQFENLTVTSTGKIESNGQGFPGSYLLGACTATNGIGCGSFGSQGGGGGSYGGVGGSSIDALGGLSYGDIDAPVDFGSGGGGAFPGISGGRGGGRVRMIIQNTFSLDGAIESNGLPGMDCGSGGGSGGSIWVTAKTMYGSGSLMALGGDGLYSSTYFGGAGSGGRIAIECERCFSGSHDAIMGTFSGSIFAHAGREVVARSNEQLPVRGSFGYSSTKWLQTMPMRGGAGTVFVSVKQNSLDASPHNYLLIENNLKRDITIARCIDSSGLLSCNNASFVLSDGITAFNQSLLVVRETIIAQQSHLVIDSYTELNTTFLTMESSSSLIVSENASISFPYDLSLRQGTLNLYGSMVGATNITLSVGASLRLSPSATWQLLADKGALPAYNANAYAYSNLGYIPHLFHSGVITLMNESTISFMGGSDNVVNRAVLVCDDLIIDDASSSVSAYGEGYEPLGLGETATSAATPFRIGQASGNITYGDGGWHAGRGGGFYHSYPTRGNAFFPVTFGAAGGSTYQALGSSGGGAIHIVASNSVVNNGIIEADGMDCSTSVVSSSGGAGAGGSVWINVVNGFLTGSGTVAARGGNGCPQGGGGGSGGRIAIYTADSLLSSFVGSLNVSSGVQSASSLNMGTTPILPAGGTIVLGYSNHTGSYILGTNHGRDSSPVYVSDECVYSSPLLYYDVEAILEADSHLVHQSCQLYMRSGFLSISILSSLALKIGVHGNVGSIEIQGALVTLNNDFNVNDVTVKFSKNSSLYYTNDISVQTNATLKVSTLYCAIVAIGGNSIQHWLSHFGNSTSMYSHVVPTAFMTESLSYIISNTIVVNASSGIQFTQVENVGFDESIEISANRLIMSPGSTLSAASVVISTDLNWDYSSATSILYSSFGNHASRKYSSSGGGHAGPGIAGTNALTTGGRRGNPLYPKGSGGAGGGDVTKRICGGGGGGGLLFKIAQLAVIDGVIDVSGGSGTLGAASAGGAGGSILFDSPGATLLGHGILRANGGNGSVSSVTAYHSGAGSGGAIAIRVCVDSFNGSFEALGGLTLRVPESVEKGMSSATYTSLLGLSSFTNTNNYRSVQEVSAASPGILTRYGIRNNGQASALCNTSFTFAQFSSPFQLNYIGVKSYDLTSFQATTNTLITNIVSSLGFVTASSITSIISAPTTLFLPTPSNIDIVHADIIEATNAKLVFSGQGDLRSAQLSGNMLGSIKLEQSIDLNITSIDTYIQQLTLNVTDNSRLIGYRDLIVENNAQLLLFHHNITDLSYRYPAGLGKLAYIRNNLTFRSIIIRNNARIAGPRLFVFTDRVSIQSNSSISSDGLGYYGGRGGEDASEGDGPGAGQYGFVGGDGGGHGGYGAPGLDRHQRIIDADQYLGLSNVQANLQDSQLNLPPVNGSVYGSYLAPIEMGSGGGGTIEAQGRGGRGGGSIVMYVAGDLYIDATSSISSSGESTYNGGGGGAGGSIWIRHTMGSQVQNSTQDVLYTGHVYGTGAIKATGGRTCPTYVCPQDIVYPGGAGGGGRIRIEKRMESYFGYVNVRSGVGNSTSQLLEVKRMGSSLRLADISTLILNITSSGEEVLDLVLTETPLFVIQVITTSGSGLGDRNSVNDIDAIVKGTWTLSYRYLSASTLPLSSQASAADVKAALQSLDHPDLRDIGVTRRPSSNNGWSWSITFYQAAERIAMIDVDGMQLWCTSELATINVKLINLISTQPIISDIIASDAPANYTFTELQKMVLFSKPILAHSSYGYWLNHKTFRIHPKTSSSDPAYFLKLVSNETDDLYLNDFFPLPTKDGYISSLGNPYLKMSYDPDWRFPTSVPSSVPSSQPSMQPSAQPSNQPTLHPTSQPSSQPSSRPTSQPSSYPSSQPSSQPSEQPSGQPTGVPSGQPSSQPSLQPSSQPSMQPSSQPSAIPTEQPTAQPSGVPTTQPSGAPTGQPSSQPSSRPTGQPSNQPSSQPSSQPVSSPTGQPSRQPSCIPSGQPTSKPSAQPSSQPTCQPSVQPVGRPTGQPSSQPSAVPSEQPTSQPSRQPTSQPSSDPSQQPSVQPSSQPSAQPVGVPTGQPSSQPTMQPSAQPVVHPTSQPSSQPISRPTGQPSSQPTLQPSARPISMPSGQPSSQPTMQPSAQPVMLPTVCPSVQPTSQPSAQPFLTPTSAPSAQPSSLPSSEPSGQPSSNPTQPTGQPTSQPSTPTSQPTSRPSAPTTQPSTQPTGQPSGLPTGQPSQHPTSPTTQPTIQPTSRPSSQPSSSPTGQPSLQPTSEPSTQPIAFPTSHPSFQPSSVPSSQPISRPTTLPTSQPTSKPSCQPTIQPSARPSVQPTSEPTMIPSSQPTSQPTVQPVIHPTSIPSCQPTSRPSSQPTLQPTSRPSSQPISHPSSQPSTQPTSVPTGQPSIHPTVIPSSQPTSKPSQPTGQPTSVPSCIPTGQPSEQPSAQPAAHPTSIPSSQPSMVPTSQPSLQPTSIPTSQPSSKPSAQPSINPSGYPTAQPYANPSGQPSSQPTLQPSAQPSCLPTSQPTIQPSSRPTTQPSVQPSIAPTTQPSSQPSGGPTSQPSAGPSTQPSSKPSSRPSSQPTARPSSLPSSEPTASPSSQPSLQPSSRPTCLPSSQPTSQPSVQPSSKPSLEPTGAPSTQPSSQPSIQPSRQPIGAPSCYPTSQPSGQPTEQPSSLPSSQPSSLPSSQPSTKPSVQPTLQPTDQPSAQPVSLPTSQPTINPTVQPSGCPSGQPSSAPSSQPTSTPSSQPASGPSSQPSFSPSSQPTTQPSTQPTAAPSGQPSSQPSTEPSTEPSSQPSVCPTSQPSSCPTVQPSSQPTASPTALPSSYPTVQPSAQPTEQPSICPTSQPSCEPSTQPSTAPTSQPSGKPSSQPTLNPSSQPTYQPSAQPVSNPTAQPSTQPSAVPSGQPLPSPTSQPSVTPTSRPSNQPSSSPSSLPSTQPTSQPAALPSGQPTVIPSVRPTDQPTGQPSGHPSSNPSQQPTTQPTSQPSLCPSSQPTSYPTCQPISSPSGQPTSSPSSQPSLRPSERPSSQPSSKPTCQPSVQPSVCPSSQPSSLPSSQPSTEPTSSPTCTPSGQPSVDPTGQPSSQPSSTPTGQPTSTPSGQPSSSPSAQPLSTPTRQPTLTPSSQPSSSPSTQPSVDPTGQPSSQPSSTPTGQPTSTPSGQPSSSPSAQPSADPTGQPSSIPSNQPSSRPSSQPTSTPTCQPTRSPSLQPSAAPTSQPTSEPTVQPTSDPTGQPSSQPSGQPTDDPTSQPSARPTDKPTKRPTPSPI